MLIFKLVGSLYNMIRVYLWIIGYGQITQSVGNLLVWFCGGHQQLNFGLTIDFGNITLLENGYYLRISTQININHKSWRKTKSIIVDIIIKCFHCVFIKLSIKKILELFVSIIVSKYKPETQQIGNYKLYRLSSLRCESKITSCIFNNI